MAIVYTPGIEAGAPDAVAALERFGLAAELVPTGRPDLLDALRPELVVNLAGSLEEGAELAARLERHGVPFTGPGARGLARAAGRHDTGDELVSGAVVVEGLDIHLALVGNDPMVVLPDAVAGGEITTFALPPPGAAADDDLCLLLGRARATLDLRDAAVAVVRVTPSGAVRLAAVHPLPSLGKAGVLAINAEREGWPYDLLVSRIIEQACRRQGLRLEPHAEPWLSP